jgi:uncharacterized zinc-type alcohol dehydrogenase-like protein
MKIHALAAQQRGQPLTSWSYESEGLRPEEVLLKVLACGICHSDVHMIDNDWAMTTYPLVPGHEIVATVVAKGSGVQHLEPDARVGVGWQRSACLRCEDCLRGDENCCDRNLGVITHGHGGFADHLVMDGRFCFHLPDELPTEFAGPLMCGGITVYGGLRAGGMGSGQRIGIIGVGGLGHLAIQFAARLGNQVTVFTTSEDKAEEATRLGAHEAILVRQGRFSRKPGRPFHQILNTAPAALPWEQYLGFLATDGTLCFVGVPSEPLSVPVFPLIVKRRRIVGSPIGGRALINEMLELAARLGVRPIIETFPLRDANAAIAKIRANTIRYRAVLLPE